MSSRNSHSQKDRNQIEQPGSIWMLRESIQKKDLPQTKTRHSKTEVVHQPFVTAAEYHSKQAQKFLQTQAKKDQPQQKTTNQSLTTRVAVHAPRKVVQHETRTGPLLPTTPERQEQLRSAQWSSVNKTSSWSKNLGAVRPRLLRYGAKFKMSLSSKSIPDFKSFFKYKNLPLISVPKIKVSMSRMQVAFVAAGLIVFAGGVTVTLMGLKTNYEVAAQAQDIQQSSDSSEDVDIPDENNKPDDKAIGQHRVAPDEPQRITIPKLKVNSRIFSMGVKADNQLDTPKNIFDTGWYRASAKPGERGAMLIDGHVSGMKKPGVFSGIHKLAQGETISVERGDGKVFNYEVVNTKEYAVNDTDMLAAVMPVVPGKQGLNLITCSGKFDSKTSQYSNRTIVFATLKD